MFAKRGQLVLLRTDACQVYMAMRATPCGVSLNHTNVSFRTASIWSRKHAFHALAVHNDRRGGTILISGMQLCRNGLVILGYRGNAIQVMVSLLTSPINVNSSSRFSDTVLDSYCLLNESVNDRCGVTKGRRLNQLNFELPYPPSLHTICLSLSLSLSLSSSSSFRWIAAAGTTTVRQGRDDYLNRIAINTIRYEIDAIIEPPPSGQFLPAAFLALIQSEFEQ